MAAASKVRQARTNLMNLRSGLTKPRMAIQTAEMAAKIHDASPMSTAARADAATPKMPTI